MKTGMKWLAGCAAILVVAGACASGGQQRERTDRSRLTQEEITSVDVLNLYDVVHRLRPRWLEVRSTRSGFSGGADNAIVVYLNNTLIGGPDELRRFGPTEAAWLQYMTGTEAVARLSGIHSRNVEGAIIIHTQDGGER